jgi:hypothetical protein
MLQRQQGQQQPFHVPHARGNEADDDESSTPAITFKLLMKKAGKDDRSRELHVSVTEGLMGVAQEQRCQLVHRRCAIMCMCTLPLTSEVQLCV